MIINVYQMVICKYKDGLHLLINAYKIIQKVCKKNTNDDIKIKKMFMYIYYKYLHKYY